jgi:hypothetical protein
VLKGLDTMIEAGPHFAQTWVMLEMVRTQHRATCEVRSGHCRRPGDAGVHLVHRLLCRDSIRSDR